MRNSDFVIVVRYPGVSSVQTYLQYFSQTNQQRWLLALAIAGPFLYYFCVVVGIDFAMSSPIPEWWLPADRVARIFSWLQITNWGGVALASLPFALAITLGTFRHRVLLALCVAVLGLVIPTVLLTSWHALSSAPLRTHVSAFLDVLKFMFTLPLLTWLLSGVGR